MNKEEIKKALIQCSDFKYCDDCPYFNRENKRCRTKLQCDALNLITEQEKEIEQFKTSNQNAIDKINELQKEINALQEENRRLDEYVSCTLSAQEFDEEIKQAKIDVLNELKTKAFDKDAFNGWAGSTFVVLVRDIDKMIEDYEK